MEVKWFCIAVAVIFASFAFADTISNYANTNKEIAFANAGLMQCLEKDNHGYIKVVWKKECKYEGDVK